MATAEQPREFDILKPEAAQEKARALLRQALQRVREEVEAGLRAPKETLKYEPLRVGGDVFEIPVIPSLMELRTLTEALERAFGPKGALTRADIDPSAVRRYPRVFAALYAWGRLVPPGEWSDVIQWEKSAASADELSEDDVLRVFTAFAHGVEGSGIAFTSDGQRMYFNPAYAEPVAKIMARCMNVSVQELCRCDRTAVVSALLEKYPTLKKLSDAFRTIEAMVEVVQRGAGVA